MTHLVSCVHLLLQGPHDLLTLLRRPLLEVLELPSPCPHALQFALKLPPAGPLGVKVGLESTTPCSTGKTEGKNKTSAGSEKKKIERSTKVRGRIVCGLDLGQKNDTELAVDSPVWTRVWNGGYLAGIS